MCVVLRWALGVEVLLGSGVNWIRCGVSNQYQLCLGLTQSHPNKWRVFGNVVSFWLVGYSVILQRYINYRVT